MRVCERRRRLYRHWCGQQWKPVSCLDERERRVLHSVSGADEGVGGKIIDLAKLGLDDLQGIQKEPDSTMKSTLKSALNPTDERIVAKIIENNFVTIPVLESELGLSREGVRKALKRLKEANVIRRVGPDRGGHWEVVAP